MIAWSIEAALKSDCIDRVIVSTDSMEIANIAQDYGAEVPFVRPSTLADDFTGTASVMTHAVEWLDKQNQSPDYVCCIYATAPFIQAEFIQNGFQRLTSSKFDYSFSITSYAFPIQRALTIEKNGTVSMIDKGNLNTRSQDLDQTWHDAGQFYWGTKSSWLEGKEILEGNSLPIKIPRHRVQDIDTNEDWVRAEFMMKALLASED